jgi:hypothetical protein
MQAPTEFQKALGKLGNTSMTQYVKTFIPKLNLLALFCLVIAALFLSGRVVTPVNIRGRTDVMSSALFIQDPETTTNELTLTWTITTIVVTSLWLIMHIPFVITFFADSKTGSRLYAAILGMAIVAFMVIVIVVGSIAASRWNVDSGNVYGQVTNTEPSQDNGGAPLLAGVLLGLSLFSCMALSGSTQTAGCFFLFLMFLES